MRTAHLCRHFAFALAACFACGSCGPSAPAATASIGAVLARDSRTGVVRVHELPDGLAGAEAGLEVGDRLKMIDGVLVDELEPERVRALLRGAPGTEVTLTVIREGEVLHVVVQRQLLAPSGGTKTKR